MIAFLLIFDHFIRPHGVAGLQQPSHLLQHSPRLALQQQQQQQQQPMTLVRTSSTTGHPLQSQIQQQSQSTVQRSQLTLGQPPQSATLKKPSSQLQHSSQQQIPPVTNRNPLHHSPESIQEQAQPQTNPISLHLLSIADDLARCSWYYGKMRRKESEVMLSQQNIGTYLLRDSESQANGFSLSWK